MWSYSARKFTEKIKQKGNTAAQQRCPFPDEDSGTTKASKRQRYLPRKSHCTGHETEAKGFTDFLMLDHEGNIAEATGANIFFKNASGEIHTPTQTLF